MNRLKVITEAILRDELRTSEPEIYYIPEGKILSPAAREYLQQRKIKIAKSGEKPPVVVATEVPPMPEVNVQMAAEVPKPKFIDYETGAFFMEKPEHMTHLYGNVLVQKNHPRILFRGKLDSLQAQIVLAQACIHEAGGSVRLIDDLGDVLRVLREMMRCDVLEEPFTNDLIIGLTHAELRERSHDPMKFFKIKQMVLPDYTMGKDYALLNQIRTLIREAEVAGNIAFREGKKCTRPDIIEELNRLSSALHIMMCMYLAGVYR
ncbi:MAG: ATP-binding protein [Butyricicoccus pullicaecorum]|nr:ATP-binding protein [Butyricicoccus pullicaecorum]